MRVKYIFIAIFFVLSFNSVRAQDYDDSAQEQNLIHPIYDDEYIPEATYEEIGERLKSLDSDIPLHYNVTVHSFINYFTVRNREYTKSVMRRSTFYFPVITEYLHKYDLPEELKYLAIVESGLNPIARSRAAAVGLWQFISSTGRIYGLHQDWYIDERMDPQMATDAACRHLKSLYNQFNDWELALAAYNCGAGNVRRAMRRSGYKEKFWDIYPYLPRETRAYVPQFVAILYSFNFAEEHNFIIDRWDFDPYIPFDTIHVNGYLNIDAIAEQLNICPDQIQKLNPGIRHQALPENVKDYVVRVPLDVSEGLAENRTAILDSASKSGKGKIEYLARHTIGSTWGRDKVTHRVRSGDVLGTIAERYHVRVADIKKWNHLYSNMIRVGQRLDIWVNQEAYARANQAPQPSADPVIIDGKKFHVVQPGDTLWSIAKIYDGLSIDKLRELNNLKSNKIKPGQKLVIG